MTIHIDPVELLGIVGTLFILLAFTRNSSAEIRIINSIGSVLFVIYGLMIGALSVWLLNGICIIINIYKLVGVHRRSKMHREFPHSEITSEFDRLKSVPDIDVKKKFNVKRKSDSSE